MTIKTRTLLVALWSAISCATLLPEPAHASFALAPVNVDPTGRYVHSEDARSLLAHSLPLLKTGHFGHAHGPDEMWCGTDLNSAEARANLAQIRADRQAGRYHLPRKGSAVPDIGDRQVFNVSETEWIELEFELVDKTSLYNLWVEVAELANGNVNQSKIDQLKSSVHDSTPSRSINPNQGTFANNHDVFGLPPNIDGDGIVDILMYDIGRGSGSTLGYVSSADQLLNPPDERTGNQRDVLYLDSNEGTRNFSSLAVIAAHEYTHLIHLSYGWDETFITEGMAEYSMVMNGFYWRGINFMSSVSEVSLPLFTWRQDQGAVGARDYERGGLFFTYIGEQLGASVVGQMMRDTEKKGAAGMDSVLALHQTSLSDVVLDYHTANRVNDTSVDPRFGFNEPERASHNAFLTSPPVNGEIASSTGEGGYSLQFNERINAGSVHYLLLTSVAGLSFVYDTPDPTGLFYQEYLQRNRARLLLEDTNGNLSTMDVTPSTNEIVVNGEFASVTFIMIHDRPEIAVGDRSSINAGWIPLSQVTDVAAKTVLPSTFLLQSTYPNPFSDRTRLAISLDKSAPLHVELVDMLGKVRIQQDHGLMSAGTHEVELDAESLESGTYLVRVVSGHQVDSQLITVIR